MISMILDICSDLKVTWERKGRTAALRKLLQQVRTSVTRSIDFVVLVRELRDAVPTVNAEPQIELRLASRKDLALLQKMTSPGEGRRFSRRVERGRLCFIALVEGCLAAYSWSTSEVEYPLDGYGAGIKLRPGDAYVYDVFTFPSYRRQGIGTSLYLYRLRYLQQQGMKRDVALVDVKNRISLDMHRSLSYCPVGRFHFRRFLSKRYFNYTVR